MNDEGFGEVDCAQLCSIVKKTEVTARIFNAIFARLLAKLYTAEKYDDVFRILDIYFLFLTLKLLEKGYTLPQQGNNLKESSGREKVGLKHQFTELVVGHVNSGLRIAADDHKSFGLQKMDPSRFFQRYPDLPNATKTRKIEMERIDQSKSQGNEVVFKVDVFPAYTAMRKMSITCREILRELFSTMPDDHKATEAEKDKFGIVVLGIFANEFGGNFACRKEEYDMNHTRKRGVETQKNTPSDFEQLAAPLNSVVLLASCCKSKKIKKVYKAPLWDPTEALEIAQKIVDHEFIPWGVESRDMSNYCYKNKVKEPTFNGQLVAKTPMTRGDTLCKYFGLDLAIRNCEAKKKDKFYFLRDMRKIGLILVRHCVEYDGYITTSDMISRVQAGHTENRTTKRYLGHLGKDTLQPLPKFCHVKEINEATLEIIKATHVLENHTHGGLIKNSHIEPAATPENVLNDISVSESNDFELTCASISEARISLGEKIGNERVQLERKLRIEKTKLGAKKTQLEAKRAYKKRISELEIDLEQERVKYHRICGN